jgi:hypothetical protein
MAHWAYTVEDDLDKGAIASQHAFRELDPLGSAQTPKSNSTRGQKTR